MQTTKGNLFTRPDTFFGICEGFGEDTRIPANLIRIGLAVGLFFNPVAAFATYGALGVLVLFTRLLFPNPKVRPAVALHAPAFELAAPAAPEAAAATSTHKPAPEAPSIDVRLAA